MILGESDLLLEPALLCGFGLMVPLSISLLPHEETLTDTLVYLALSQARGPESPRVP